MHIVITLHKPHPHRTLAWDSDAVHRPLGGASTNIGRRTHIYPLLFTTVQSPRSIYETMELTSYVLCQCVNVCVELCRWEAMGARHGLRPMSGYFSIFFTCSIQLLCEVTTFQGMRARLLFVASCDVWLLRLFAMMGRQNPSKWSSVILWLQNVLKCRMNIATVSGWTQLQNWTRAEEPKGTLESVRSPSCTAFTSPEWPDWNLDPVECGLSNAVNVCQGQVQVLTRC